MKCIREIAPSIFAIGSSDRRQSRFENMIPIPEGMAYNSYIIFDEKIALFDTTDLSVIDSYFANLDGALQDSVPNYLILQHVEPDHTASVATLLERYPSLTLVGSAKAMAIQQQFINRDLSHRFHVVSEGDELSLGEHTLSFVSAPMVHWPEVIFTYEKKERILFSADAFGAFGASNGQIFADEYETVPLDYSRRYYANIVGKYGAQVRAVLKKMSSLLPLAMVCPLHGPIWREELDTIFNKYNQWAQYEAEEKGVVIAYGSMYGNTASVAQKLADLLIQRGIKNVKIHDVSSTHPSYIIADIFQYSNLVLASPTYNMGLYYPVHSLLHEMEALNVQNRNVSLIGNASWVPLTSIKLMQDMLDRMKNITQIGHPLSIQSAIQEKQEPELLALADDIVKSLS